MLHEESALYDISEEETALTLPKMLRTAEGSWINCKEIFQSLLIITTCWMMVKGKKILRELAMYRDRAYDVINMDFGGPLTQRHYVSDPENEATDHVFPTAQQLGQMTRSTPMSVILHKYVNQTIANEVGLCPWSTNKTVTREHRRCMVAVADDATAELVRTALIQNGTWTFQAHRCELVQLHRGFITPADLEKYSKAIDRAPCGSVSECFVESHRSRLNLECAFHKARAVATWMYRGSSECHQC